MNASTLKNKKSIIAWCLFDWANSAFPIIVTTFIFATYFTKSIAKNTILGTAQWGDATALAGICIAILSPLLGAIADNEGRRKPWLALFSMLCIVSSALLWFAKPSSDYVTYALTWVVLGTIGLEVGMVFYNSMLSDIAPPSHTGRISGWSWGVGYFGGLLCLIIALVFFVEDHFHLLLLDKTTLQQVRICGPLVGAWFLAFAWPLFIWTPDKPSTGMGITTSIRTGLSTLLTTLKSLKKHPDIIKFLIARILYIDGLNTIFAFGGIYAAGTFHMSFAEVLKFGIVLNVGAGIGAIFFAWMDDLKGSKLTILLTLIVMLITGTSMLVVTQKASFWALGIVLSLCVGPIQAASRSLMVRLSPKDKITELFGLYAFSGKATAFIGPWIFGTFTLLFKSQRAGMGTVMVFLLLGAGILFFVKNNKNQ